MSNTGHEFGGISTDLKLAIVEGYLQSFTTALRPYFTELWYFDAFAGTGERTVRHAAQVEDFWGPPTLEAVEQRRGSARIAIETVPAFDRLVFIDRAPNHITALERLANEHPNRDITVRSGDANSLILEILSRPDWSRARGVMFLDPYGMQVDWTTLEAVRATGAIDVWYLVSLAGLFRQAARDRRKLDEVKRSAITRMLGTADWEAAWYEAPSTPDLFEQFDENASRTADVSMIERYVRV